MRDDFERSGVGDFSIGAFFALGVLAISSGYAIGDLTLGSYAIGNGRVNQDFLQLHERIWPSIREKFNFR